MRPGTVESTFSFLFFLAHTRELHVFFWLLQLKTHQEKKIPSLFTVWSGKGIGLALFSCVFGLDDFRRTRRVQRRELCCSARSEGGHGHLPPAWGCPCSQSGLHSSLLPCLHLPLPCCLAFVCWDPSSRLRLEEGLIFLGFDVLIPQRSCLLLLHCSASHISRSAALFASILG